MIAISDNYLKNDKKIHSDLKKYLTILGLKAMISISCTGFNGRGIQIPIRLIKDNVLCLLQKWLFQLVFVFVFFCPMCVCLCHKDEVLDHVLRIDRTFKQSQVYIQSS